jgi:hypothetical protein
MTKSKAREVTRAKARAVLDASFKPQFWEELDEDLPITRKLKKLYRRLKDDTASTSAPKSLICQRAAFIAVQLESLEVAAVEKGKLDVGVYTQSVNALSGLLSKLGLEKKVATTKGGLKAYLRDAG